MKRFGSTLALSLFLGACISPPVEAPLTIVEQETDVSTEQNLRDQVDLLFLIDDSGSMSPKQEALKQRFPDLINVLNEFAAQGNPADYHIGVVTSDLGAPGISCGSNLGGKLQGVGLAKNKPLGCEGPVGKRFIEFNQKDSTNNLPGTQTLAETFSCMASVVDENGTTGGHTGCGFEMQLEAVYRALHDPIPENQGFLRPGAILAIVFVTDEDDCSADPTSDLFTANPAYGPLNSYRCAAYGYFCDGMLLPSTPQASFQSCVPATAAQGGKLSDVNKYINFFTQPSTKGGVKANPRDVILASIMGPPTPVGSESVSGAQVCGQGVTSCTNISHSCVAPDNAAFFGDPSVRLSAVINAAMNKQITSICDTDYKTALEGIGQKIVSALQPSCLTSPIKDPNNPDCVVEDVTIVAGEEQRRGLPYCPDAPGTFPCWQLKTIDKCNPVCNPVDLKNQRIGVEINRNGQPAPDNTTAQVSCNTIAIPNQGADVICTD
jgi:hypothetical protein